MSLNNFAELFVDLDSINSTNKKIELLQNYFSSNEYLENSWTIFFLTGKNNKRYISGRKLKYLFAEIYECPIWLIETCYSKVGDSAEVVSLLLKNKKNNKNNNLKNISLNDLLIKNLSELLILKDDEMKLKIKEIWENLPEENYLVFNKILTGTFRVGVSIGLITKSISKLTNLPESIISHRLMGNFKPSIESYELLIKKEIIQEELNYKPFPFLLASNYEKKISESSITNFQFEWKWDGIRIQLIKREGNVSIWSRGQELINQSFPELEEKTLNIKEDFVMDGELLVWNFQFMMPMNFSYLQKRINRKNPSKSLQKNLPIKFIVYDLLEIEGKDIRELILEKRRKLLEKYYAKWMRAEDISNLFKVSKLIYPKDWEVVWVLSKT